MAVSVMARCGPGLQRPSSATGPRRVQQQQQPAVGRSPFARCVRVAPRSPLAGPAGAFYRTAGGPSSWDEEAMKELMADMAKAWKAGGGMSGGFFWPGAGGAYAYGGSRCKPNSSSCSGATSSPTAAAGSRALALDVVSTEGFYLLFADVPGLAKADLSIKLSKDRVLSVAGDRRPPLGAEQADTSFRQKERRYGAFERSWALPDDADSEGISAKVADGVLTITVPKVPPQPEVDDAQEIAIN